VGHDQHFELLSLFDQTRVGLDRKFMRVGCLELKSISCYLEYKRSVGGIFEGESGRQMFVFLVAEDQFVFRFELHL
jgi:hypothetical protein